MAAPAKPTKAGKTAKKASSAPAKKKAQKSDGVSPSGMSPTKTVSYRQIENGWLVSEEVFDGKNWARKERFSPTEPKITV